MVPVVAAVLALTGGGASLADRAVAAEMPAVAPGAIDGVALEHARKVVDVVFPPEGREALFLGSQKAIVNQLRTVELAKFQNDPEGLAILDRNLDAFMARAQGITRDHIPDMIDGIAHAYAREFTSAELDSIAAFVGTPAGHHFTSRSTAILGDPDVVAANRRLFLAVQPLQAELQATLTRELAQHFADHPPKPAHGS